MSCDFTLCERRKRQASIKLFGLEGEPWFWERRLWEDKKKARVGRLNTGSVVFHGIFAQYARYYRSLKRELEEEFGDKIKVVPMEDQKITGNFEVTMRRLDDSSSKPTLIHSKKAGGGRCESAAEVQAIVDKINEALGL